MLTFYQLSTKVSVVYDVSLPAEVNAFLDSMTGWISFGMTGIATTPLECLNLSGYIYRLLFWIAVPVVLVLMIILIVLCSLCFTKSRGKRVVVNSKEDASHGGAFHLDSGAEPERTATFFEKVLPPVLTILLCRAARSKLPPPPAAAAPSRL